jgi:hypothetical protein
LRSKNDLCASGYDHLVQHKNDHERLLDEIRDLMEDFEASDRFDEHWRPMRGFPALRDP